MKLLTAALVSASLLGLAACKPGDEKQAMNNAGATAEASAEDALNTARNAGDMASEATQRLKPAAISTSAVEAARWLKANGARPDVVTLPSGLQYTVNTASKNPGNSPAPGQVVKVHYEGKLIDGTVFDSSYERGRPAQFPSDRLIQGWVEALGMMSPGDEWTLYVPPALAYGSQGRPSIPANSVLIFRMELLENM